MSVKKTFIKSQVDSRLLFLNYWLLFLIYIMLIIVLYDSVIHNTPLYYAVFYIVGMLLGRAFSYTMSIENNHQGKLTLSSNIFYTLITFSLLLIRYILGKTMLEYINIVWTTDALYLLFIGIYYSKWKTIIRKIDNYIYTRVSTFVDKS